MINVSHIIITVAVELVIVGVAAIIVTEFFVGTAMQAAFAAETGFSSSNHKLV